MADRFSSGHQPTCQGTAGFPTGDPIERHARGLEGMTKTIRRPIRPLDSRLLRDIAGGDDLRDMLAKDKFEKK